MKLRSWSLLAGVILLAVLPLAFIHKPAPGPDGQEREIFTGSDDQASAAISSLDPAYRRWAHPVFEPASSEIESLLFALQAAMGAGVIGYWLGVSMTREKLRRDIAAAQAAEDAAEQTGQLRHAD
jgi:cobalt/nickel transport protein